MIQIRRSALVRYSPTQMFDLVNDVETYPRRFTWCVGATVLERTDAELTARMEVRAAGFTQTFTTRNTLERPSRMGMKLVDGPFRSLEGDWTFAPLGDIGCKIGLALDFEYSNKLVGSVLQIGFQGLADRMVDEFCREAARTYA